MKKCPLTGLSQEAIKCLPGILDEAGYAGKYELHPEWNTILIATTNWLLKRLCLLAESKAKGEAGRLITIKKTSYSQLWIPETEADTLLSAYTKAFSHVENGWPVNNDERIEVTGIEDNSYWDKDAVEEFIKRRS